jgi:hypothetical protein
MAPIAVSAERAIPAPASAVYALLADYEVGHPSILPSAFSDFSVLEGGIGAGTVIRYRLELGGRSFDATARVAEPEPGRVLTETDLATGAVTTFTVTPRNGECLLRFDTVWEPRRGIGGLIERIVAPRLFRPLYDEELNRIVQWAEANSRTHEPDQPSRR